MTTAVFAPGDVDELYAVVTGPTVYLEQRLGEASFRVRIRAGGRDLACTVAEARSLVEQTLALVVTAERLDRQQAHHTAPCRPAAHRRRRFGEARRTLTRNGPANASPETA